ncbi:hypothetical protein [Zunongwangia sp. H14]|uniref:hypothetical protein n=1 Tax=Zunongwangia sp. H14 TaxID=3240792 RepID=UPI003569CA1D
MTFPFINEKGISNFESIYGNNRDLEIGKKSLTNVIGRIEEQSTIASKLFNIKKSNKLLTIKASGGTGKTTLIKKVAYELYNRGYYHEGVSFKSCENVKTFEGFEELLIEGFNLTNIINFKEYLIENFSHKKLDLLVILDNFETVANELDEVSLIKAKELLMFATDYASIVITSRERLSSVADFEDVYSLTPLITDDALVLFEENYGKVRAIDEIKILRNEILEDLLNNNPLAIKLVTNSRTRFRHISELKKQLKENFFESTNEDFTKVFTENADLNIERTKSIYQSINYSYSTLSSRQKIAFELLNLFPDGISLSNFKKCFKNSASTNNISDKELRVLKDKSLVEDYNGTLQLQPIIRRFAEFQFKRQPLIEIKKYCLDAYSFNSFILDIIQFIEKKESLSRALELFNHFKNNLLNVLTYIPEIEIKENGSVPEKKYLLNFIYDVEDFVLSKKQVNEFLSKLHELEEYFADLPNATTFLKVLRYNKEYFHREFDHSYQKLSSFLSTQEMKQRNFKEEDYLEKRFKNIVSNVHSMEGYTFQYLMPFIENNETKYYLDSHFFYLGIADNISRKEPGFYYFEYDLMFKRLEIRQLEDHINSLYMEEHLEIMQCTYTLSKVKPLKHSTIQKLVVTNPYTRGLKELMFAFNCEDDEKKQKHFEKALRNLSHIKYYYLEALYYYAKFLQSSGSDQFVEVLKEGLVSSEQFKYQYIYHLFTNFEQNKSYEFKYSFYPIETLENYVKNHNNFWEEKFKTSEDKYSRKRVRKSNFTQRS